MCLQTISRKVFPPEQTIICWKVLVHQGSGFRTPFNVHQMPSSRGTLLSRTKWTKDVNVRMIPCERITGTTFYTPGFHAWVNRSAAFASLRELRKPGMWSVWTNEGLVVAKVALREVVASGSQRTKHLPDSKHWNVLVGRQVKVLAIEQ